MMIHNGLDKLGNIESFAQAYVEVIGLPLPIFFSSAAAFTELIGSTLLIFGLFTRPAAFGLFSTMCVAMYHHVLVAGFNIPYLELSAVYAACNNIFYHQWCWFIFYRCIDCKLARVSALSAQAKQIMRLEKAYEASNSKEKVAAK
ncbi:MAG: DoxX family protein [Rivularia sp. (in: cyanobacteria)]